MESFSILLRNLLGHHLGPVLRNLVAVGGIRIVVVRNLRLVLRREHPNRSFHRLLALVEPISIPLTIERKKRGKE